MPARLSETRLEREDGNLRLVDASGQVMLTVARNEVDDAVRMGFLDPDDYHYSMFEYARIKRDVATATTGAENRSARNPFERYLADQNIGWEDDAASGE
ncbi:MAG TPA: hypothetical protein VKD69_09530 [Vicinamibacterales bacterium]|nr:hypothetical protein [Vicinamibacterales bacterium]